MKNDYRVRDDGVAEIALTRGQVALVDVEDLPRLARYRWCADAHHGGGFHAVSGKDPAIIMSRLLLDAQDDELVDHDNHRTLDNRKQNLRICTHSQNNANRRKTKNVTSSQYKGVCWHKPGSKWQARIKLDGKYRALGYYESEKEAACAYDAAALRLFGDFALPNFPGAH